MSTDGNEGIISMKERFHKSRSQVLVRDIFHVVDDSFHKSLKIFRIKREKA